MNESAPSREPKSFLGSRSLVLLCIILLTGLLLQVILARMDRSRVATLESFSEGTAVGDRVYYPLPSPLPDPPIVVARLRGEALVPVSYEKFSGRDTNMQAIARDPVTKLTIYESREPLPGAAGEKRYFAKTASNEYLTLRAKK
jgi:hypothetical protein